MTKPTQDKETLREAAPSYKEAKAALDAAKCQTCMGLGTCDDASPHDISFNTWKCRDCGGTGLRNENFIRSLIDAAIATMSERLRDDLCRDAYERGFWDGAEEQRHCDGGEIPHKDCVTEGYQNWLANPPALTALQQENSDA